MGKKNQLMTSPLPGGCLVGSFFHVPISKPSEVVPIYIFVFARSSRVGANDMSLPLHAVAPGSQTRACKLSAQCSNPVSHHAPADAGAL